MKSYTNIEQSKKLAEILPLESADMWYWHFPTAPTYNNYGYPMFHKGEDIHNVPCWSLSALLDVLPDGTTVSKDKADTENEKYMCVTEAKDDIISTFGNNPVDACVDMIIKLHKQNLL